MVAHQFSLFTHWGTRVYYEAVAGELRHGPSHQTPNNVSLLPCRDFKGETDHAILCVSIDNRIEIFAIDANQPTDFKTPQASLTRVPTLSIIPIAESLLGLSSGNVFLCAEKDGRVTLSRTWLREWETFSVVETASTEMSTPHCHPANGACPMFAALEELRRRGFNPSSILDVGAYTGEFSERARSIFPEAFILMIDALEENQTALMETCKRIGNAEYRLVVLGDSENAATPFYVVDSEVHPNLVKTGSSKYKENAVFSFNERTLTQTTLRKLLKPLDRKFELIKLDVQGAELDVLKGAGEMVSDVEVAIVELPIVDYNQGAPSIDQVLSELRQLNLVLYDIVGDHRWHGNRLFQIDGLFVRPDSGFRPKPPFHG